ncbi:MAG: glutamine--tRNA ligase [Candidatus Marinimicrobia bacterium]|nr:glutamine--tRNA ligase [Candidatus Neomarinimicrobiota bacterium]|tara:strand:- start:1414 stop:3072 length:1659 start_codon:yes stop_codon:yes gene_type:complete
MNKELKSTNFIREIIEQDLKDGKNNGRIHTRFPPEPNGYLHIGHAKSICINFGLAKDYNGKCNLRFDDTNPVKEEKEFVQSIIEDVAWLGFDLNNGPLFASDYFDQMYSYAIQLIKKGKAYVDDQSGDQIRDNRGTLNKPGVDSPFRDRNIKDNLDLFLKMKNGVFKNGEKVLRAKIDMSSPNINLRDPIIYRILHSEHHRTGNKWCIYPMYDWAHGLEDSIEGITHSICTLEFEDHRPLYNWFLSELEVHHPRQIEFARLNLNYTVMSKRKLKSLVDRNYVASWDDPRMPTLSGLRRRGYSPKSIRDFVSKTGVVKRNGVSDIALLESCLREDLNQRSTRVMAVLDPVKLVITNYPKKKVEKFKAVNNPEDESAGKREVLFSREIYIDRSDFMENPPKKFFRLGVGREVRLKHAYYVTCESVVKNDANEIIEIRCTYDPESRGGWSNDGRKVKGTLQWISVEHAINAEVRLYDSLFLDENPEKTFLDNINPESIIIKKNCKLEPYLQNAKLGEFYQFIRIGYFCADNDFTLENMVFNKTVGLRDTWGKKQK